MSSDEIFNQACHAEASAQPELAFQLYQDALRVDPADADAATNLGLVSMSLGRVAAAAAAHRCAQALQPHRRRTEAQRLLDGGRIFGELAPAPAALSSAAHMLRELLHQSGYNPTSAHAAFGASHGAAGGPPTASELFRKRLEIDAPPASRLQALHHLFLFGLALDHSVAAAALGDKTLQRLLEHGLLLHSDGSKVVAPIQVYPLALAWPPEHSSECALIATDWDLESLLPPRTTIMPVGVDSLELALTAPRGGRRRVLDLCAGSGVQGIVAALAGAEQVVAADVNPRALCFCAFNAALNDVAARIHTVASDVYSGVDGKFDAILCNPPFVAVPAAVRARCEDWALFADGGDDGAVVLRAVVAGAAARLAPSGWLMIVTEVPNIERAHRWLLDEEDTSGQLRLRVVFNPRHVQSADEYAADRARERVAADAEAWAAALRASFVASMGSALLIAARGEGGGKSVPHSADVDGSEERSVLVDGLPTLRAALRELVPS